MTTGFLAAAALALYALGARRIGGWRAFRTVSFATGLLTVAVAVAEPLDSAADRSLTAHMAQHGLLTLIAPPLLALGAPVRLALRALPPLPRRRLGRLLAGGAGRLLSHPATGAVALSAVLVLWHLTGLYELALRDPQVHAAEHGCYLWAGMLLWVPLIGADPLPHPPGALARVAAVMAVGVAMGAVGAVLVSADAPRYRTYAAHAGRGPGVALDDQRAAGTVMWVGSGVLLVPAAVGLAAGALVAEERRQRRRERHAEAALIGGSR